MSEQEEFTNWLRVHAKDSGQKIKDSAIYAGIVTDSFLKEPLCALQLGFSILMDKPIILIVDKSTTIPESLVKVAQVIERVDVKNPDDMARASKSIKMFARNR